MSDGSSLEVWFEFASTYSYIACSRLAHLSASGQAPTIVWKPFLLGPIFAAQGWTTSPFLVYESKGRYMWRDMERLCADHGLPFRRPEIFPQNSVLAARVACVGEGQDWLPGFCDAVYRANFGHGQDISDPCVLRDILNGLGATAHTTLEEAQAPENKHLLRGNTEEAIRRGVFGAPTLFANTPDGGSEMFWGADRLDRALAWIGWTPPEAA